MTRLAGKVAIVTGAGSGIGRATARRFAAEGARVVVAELRAEPGRETVALIAAAGGEASFVQTDVTVKAAAQGMVQHAVAAYGRLDILVNNAGSPVRCCRLEDCPTELWRQVLDVNLTSAFIVTRQAIPHLRASGRGCIVNNLTLSIQTGGSGGAGPYAAAKGGLQVLTRTLARELAPAIRVNAIMPGVIETRHHEQFSTPTKMEDYRRQTPLARNGTSEEVAQAVLFLVSDAASFITGSLLDINGGRFLR